MDPKPLTADEMMEKMGQEIETKGPKKGRGALIKREVKHFDSADHEKNKQSLSDAKPE